MLALLFYSFQSCHRLPACDYNIVFGNGIDGKGQRVREQVAGHIQLVYIPVLVERIGVLGAEKVAVGAVKGHNRSRLGLPKAGIADAFPFALDGEIADKHKTIFFGIIVRVATGLSRNG